MIDITVKTYYSASELAAMRLPMIPTTKANVIALAERSKWAAIEVRGRGGLRREYQPPADVMAAIKDIVVTRALNQPAPASVATVLPSCSPLPAASAPRAMTVATQAGPLKDWQKRTAEARVAILREVDRIAQVVGREKAVMKVVIMAQDGTLPEHLAQLVPVANARAGQDGKRTLSRRTIYDWFKSYQPAANGVNAVDALAPKDQHAVIRIPTWATDLMVEYQRPQKPSLSWAVEQVAAKHGLDKDTLYHRARRFLGKMGNVELQAGRMGARDIKNIKPFVRRDSGMLWPADVYTADGHTFDAEIAHPAHGKPFRPEVTTVLDVGTRRAVGWSVDLAESGLAVLDALRHACEIGGIPSAFYVDNGSGYKNALMSQPGVGMESRLGFTMTHSIAYNSQARGVIERAHQTLWVRAAKQLPTYIGDTMDAQAKQKVHKLTRRDVALAGRSRYLMAFNDFITFCNNKIDEYNNRPHRSLPMLFDPVLGRRRHMSPNEAWAQGVKDGAQLVTVTVEEARELFRPQREAKVLRGEIRLFNNLYFAQELTEYHGDIVRVAYDIHNGDQVWVYDQQGRFICSAGFEANKRAYFSESFLEQAARKRADGRARRLEAKLEEVRLEQQGTPLRDVQEPTFALENNASPVLQLMGDLNTPREEVAALNLDTPASLSLASDEEMRLTAPDNSQSDGAARPIFLIDSDRYEWLMQHRHAWTDSDRQFLDSFVHSDIYEALRERFEALGVAWDGSEGEVFKVAV